MCLHYPVKLEILIMQLLLLSDKETQEFIPCHLWPPNSPDLNPVDYSMWECCKRRCTKHASLIWYGSRSSLSRLKPEDCTLEISATVMKPTDLSATLASCSIASWPWSDTSARRSASAFTIYTGFGNSDVTWTSIPWGSWCQRLFSVDSTFLYCRSVRATSVNHQPFATSVEHRCSGHTWSVTARPCPSGTDGAALAASRSSYPIQGCAFDVYGTWQPLSCVSKWICSMSQQQPSMSTSSLCQQPRLHVFHRQELSLENFTAGCHIGLPQLNSSQRHLNSLMTGYYTPLVYFTILITLDIFVH